MRVLFIAGHEFINKQDNGGRKCSFRNYTTIKEIVGNDNLFLCMLSNEALECQDEKIQLFSTHKNKWQQIYNTLHLRNGYNANTEKKIINYINGLNPDVIFFDFSIIGGLLKKISIESKNIVFLHNIEKNYMKNKIRNEGIIYFLPYISYSYNEKLIINNADKIICLNKRDNQELKKTYGKAADFQWPITFKDEFDLEKSRKFRRKEKQRKELLFVGSLFPPNYKSIKWFVQNVMPYLPECNLKIVGKNMEKKRKEFESENVEVIGTVEDLSSYYYNTEIVIIPILYGNGMKIKTAEAMMYGKPIIASAEALEGYEYENVLGIKRCDSITEYVEGIKQMLLDYNSEKFQNSTRKLFIDKYESTIQKEKVKEFFDNLLEE